MVPRITSGIALIKTSHEGMKAIMINPTPAGIQRKPGLLPPTGGPIYSENNPDSELNSPVTEIPRLSVVQLVGIIPNRLEWFPVHLRSAPYSRKKREQHPAVKLEGKIKPIGRNTQTKSRSGGNCGPFTRKQTAVPTTNPIKTTIDRRIPKSWLLR